MLRLFEKPLGERWSHVDLSGDNLIAGLREYVKGNTALPQRFQQYRDGSEKAKLTNLVQAIEAGNLDESLLADSESMVMIQFLIEDKQVCFWLGMTAYMYALAHHQAKEFESSNVEPTKLVSDNGSALTKDGEQFVESLCSTLRVYRIAMTVEALTEFILKAKPLNQQVMTVSYQTVANSKSYQQFRIVMDNIPIIPSGADDENDYYHFQVPSFALINFIFSKMGTNPLQLKPILGRIGEHTLVNLHRQDQHPVACYSPLVKSNYNAVHDEKMGSLGIMLHDVGHAFQANLLSNLERKNLFERYVPALAKLESESSSYLFEHTLTDANKSKVYGYFYSCLVDYNLTPISDYRRKSERYDRYVRDNVRYRLSLFDRLNAYCDQSPALFAPKL